MVEPVARRLASVARPEAVSVLRALLPETARTLVATLVDVAFVEVEFPAVKFWRVDDEFTTKFWRVARPEVKTVESVVLPDTVKMFEAKLVEVEFVVVEFAPVKFWRVVDPVARRLARVATPDEESVLNVAFPETESTFVAKVVEVAKVEVAVTVVMLLPELFLKLKS